MKPASFDYYAPAELTEALALLAQHGYDAKVLAGGQSLIPTMNFRLAQPSVLIDLNHIRELFYIRQDAEKHLRIGAMTRQGQMERNTLVAADSPLLHEGMSHIAHSQIRNRGTIGGSLAHADPAAELPVIATVLNADFRVVSQHGERWVAARDFYVGLFTTALEPEELLVEIKIPPMAPRTGWAIEELARRHGDYAIVGVAAQVVLDETGRCSHAEIAFLSVGDGPVRATQAAAKLLGEASTPALIDAAAATAATVDIDPPADIHASVAYRRHLAKILTARALNRAFERAEQN